LYIRIGNIVKRLSYSIEIRLHAFLISDLDILITAFMWLTYIPISMLILDSLSAIFSFVRFEVLMGANMKITAFWYKTFRRKLLLTEDANNRFLRNVDTFNQTARSHISNDSKPSILN
jgi:hypothetical protein